MLGVIMLGVIMLGVIMLGVIMLGVIMLGVKVVCGIMTIVEKRTIVLGVAML